MSTIFYKSPLGAIALEFGGDALLGLRFEDGEDLDTQSCMDVGSPIVSSAMRWLDDYFEGRQPADWPPLRPFGTLFQRRVWQQLMQVPYGHTISYGELAHMVGCRSAQAVGQAVGCNPVAIIVPCHRVVGADGSLTGYAYGLARKRALLELEAGGHRLFHSL